MQVMVETGRWLVNTLNVQKSLEGIQNNVEDVQHSMLTCLTLFSLVTIPLSMSIIALKGDGGGTMEQLSPPKGNFEDETLNMLLVLKAVKSS